MSTRYVAFDLRSGVQLGGVPLGNVIWTQRLNANHELTGRVDLAERMQDGTSIGAHYRDILVPGKTKLAVVPDEGDPVSFVVWERSFDGDRYLTIRCAGIWSYIARYPLTSYRAFADTEQFDIARTLIAWVLANSASNIGLRIENDSASGVYRDATYQGFEHRPVGEIVAELATEFDGFEYSIESSGGVSRVVDTWTPHYPMQGTTFDDDPKTIALPKVPGALSLVERQPPVKMTLLGAGEGADMVTASLTSQSLLSEGYPMLPVTVPYKSETSAGVLAKRISGELFDALRRRKVWRLDIPVDVERYETTSLGLGDEVRIDVAAGTYPLYPEGLVLLQRVIARTVTVNDNGNERIVFELGETGSAPDPVVATVPIPEQTYRVVGTGDSILAMAWGLPSPGSIYTTADRWLDFEYGRAPYTPGLAGRASTAGIWPDILERSEPDGWVIVQDNSLGPTDEEWAALMQTIRDELPADRNLVVVLPAFLASVNATISETIATRATIMFDILGTHPHANFVDLPTYMAANPSQFPDGQHPDATAQAWIRGEVEALTG